MITVILYTRKIIISNACIEHFCCALRCPLLTIPRCVKASNDDNSILSKASSHWSMALQFLLLCNEFARRLTFAKWFVKGMDKSNKLLHIQTIHGYRQYLQLNINTNSAYSKLKSINSSLLQVNTITKHTMPTNISQIITTKFLHIKVIKPHS